MSDLYPVDEEITHEDLDRDLLDNVKELVLNGMPYAELVKAAKKYMTDAQKVHDIGIEVDRRIDQLNTEQNRYRDLGELIMQSNDALKKMFSVDEFLDILLDKDSKESCE